ncbi:MAG: long-chain fatty acid--CoA ligase [Rhodospirillaceae bacterium]
MLLAGQMMDRPLLVLPLLQHAARHHADSAIVTLGADGTVHRTTYAETYERVQRLAHALVRLGIKPGDRVATLALNTFRHLDLYFAVAGIGAVCHTVNPRLPPDQLRYLLGHAEDRLLFFDTCFAEQAAALVAGVPTLERVIALADAAHAPADDRFGDLLVYDTLIAREGAAFPWPEFDENTAAALCYTSGTTGLPKGVLYSHRALVLHSFAVAANGLASAGDVLMPVVPMFHVNAWGIPHAAPLMGAPLVFGGPAFDGPRLFHLMDEEAVTCAQGVPTLWQGLVAEMRARGRRPKALTRVVVGGAAVSDAMIRAFEDEFGVEVCHAWGMTETTPLGVINRPKEKFQTAPRERQIRQKLKQGIGVYGVEIRIADGEGRSLPHDGASQGHIQVRGPWIIRSYFKEDHSPLTADGWFDTGDIGTLDPDGYMEITDRAKDVIKSGGEWISSSMLENAALGHPQVAQAAVIGVPHERWLERPLLVCVPRGAAPTLGEINAFLATRLPKWWLPDALECVDALPIGPTGKILKTRLRERFKHIRLG